MTRSKINIFSDKKGHNSMINMRTSSVFELIRAFIPRLLLCKFQEDLIKTKGLVLMTR